jgi:beta-lactamase superfamily II metal-dependent hydrolase
MVSHRCQTGGQVSVLLTGDIETAVISVGADNDFGHPCAGVLERLEEMTAYRTDEQCVVEIVTDGAQAWVETER